MNPVVRRYMSHQGVTFPVPPQAPSAPRMVGTVAELEPGGSTSCSLRSFLGDKGSSSLTNNGASLAGVVTLLALGGAGAGLLLAGRPFSGAALGVAAGAGVSAYQYSKWKRTCQGTPEGA